jgi:protein Mpv17
MFRTRRLAVYGGLVFAPIANRWHTLVLNKIVLANRRWGTVVARVVVDQTIFAPLATCLFYGTQGMLESRPWSSLQGTQGIKERLEERLIPTVMKQWMVFGPSGFLNVISSTSLIDFKPS